MFIRRRPALVLDLLSSLLLSSQSSQLESLASSLDCISNSSIARVFDTSALSLSPILNGRCMSLHTKRSQLPLGKGIVSVLSYRQHFGCLHCSAVPGAITWSHSNRVVVVVIFHSFRTSTTHTHSLTKYILSPLSIEHTHRGTYNFFSILLSSELPFVISLRAAACEWPSVRRRRRRPHVTTLYTAVQQGCRTNSQFTLWQQVSISVVVVVVVMTQKNFFWNCLAECVCVCVCKRIWSDWRFKPHSRCCLRLVANPMLSASSSLCCHQPAIASN